MARDRLITVAAGPADESVLVAELTGAAVIVDALFGIGLTRPLEPPYPRWIELMNAAPAVRVAADVPSGLDADSGRSRPVAVRADVTAAMGFVKQGCRSPAGSAYSGRIVEIDIGLPSAIHSRFRSAPG